MDYEDAMEYIDSINKTKGMVFGLEPVKNMLAHLGSPEKNLRIIHIAGTNGKGSTGAFLSGILSEAGYKVGRFVSPVVDGYRERIQYEHRSSGKDRYVYISESETAKYLTEIKRANELLMPVNKRSLTSFEIETVMAVMSCADWKCDYVILECGLGGAGDATNAIDNKELCIFTSISKDHMSILGDDIKAIAAEKAGILRDNVKAVSAVMSDEIMSVLNYYAKKHSTKVELCEKCSCCEYSLSGTDFYIGMDNFHIKLPGIYQPDNAALAVKAAKELIGDIETDVIWQGLEKTFWPGRFQVIRSNPYVIIDGAHNEDGIRVLKESILLYFGKNNNIGSGASGEDICAKPIGIMGVFADKDVVAMLNGVKGIFSEIHTVTAPSDRAVNAAKLAELIEDICGIAAYPHDKITAMEVCDMLTDNGCCSNIVIFGSLSLVSAAALTAE